MIAGKLKFDNFVLLLKYYEKMSPISFTEQHFNRSSIALTTCIQLANAAFRDLIVTLAEHRLLKGAKEP